MAPPHPQPPARRRLRTRRPRGLVAGAALCLVAGATWCLSAGPAHASPGITGTRPVSMGGQSAASSTGTAAVLNNPAGLGMSGQFAIDPMYQIAVADRTHGVGAVVSDSLNNSWVALGLGYLFTRGAPTIGLTDAMGDRQNFRLSHFGHEVVGVLTINAVRNWLSIGLKPKYQYTSLRYRDEEGIARDARRKQSAFGLDAAVTINAAGWARIAVIGENLTGPARPAWTESGGLDRPLQGISLADNPDFELSNLRRVSDYPRSLVHSIAVYPLGRPNFSIGVDGRYDFTSFWDQDRYVRKLVGGALEFIVIDRVPLRAGGFWDSRGRGGRDDRGYLSAGLGFVMPPKVGGAGVDIGVGVTQQIAGPARYGMDLDTILAVNIGIRLHPDL